MPLTPASWRVFRRRFLTACLAAVVVMTTSIVYLNWKVGQTLADVKKVTGLDRLPDGPAEGGNFLIIGSDSRAFVENADEERAFGSAQQEAGQRADVMMVLHIDPETKTSLLVSFPRDLLVRLPDGSTGQINAVFNQGPQAIVDMLQSDFDIDINHYVQVNFKAFIGVVNAVGDIPVYFPYPARDRYSGLDVPSAGCIALNGDAALAYVRSRHLEELESGSWKDASPRADLDRIQRQQDFIRKLAAAASAKAGGNPLDAIEIADAVVPKLLVDEQLSKTDILRLVKTFRNVDPEQEGALEMVTIPNVASSSQSGRLEVDDAAAAPVLARLRTFGGSEAPPKRELRPADVLVRVLNGSEIDGAAGKALGKLQERGFSPDVTGNTGAAALTEVRYPPGKQAEAELVARYLGGVGQLVADPSVADVDVVVVVGADWRGVHGKDKEVEAPTTTTTSAPQRSKGSSSTTVGPAPAC